MRLLRKARQANGLLGQSVLSGERPAANVPLMLNTIIIYFTEAPQGAGDNLGYGFAVP